MSELINTQDNRSAIHWKLLTGGSALALAAYMGSTTTPYAANSEKPIVSLEASGQFDQLSSGQMTWVPEFVPGYPVGPLADQYTSIQRSPRIGFDAGASISFQPENSDWSLRASVRIGKARQPGNVAITQHQSGFGRFAYDTHYDGISHDDEDHFIVDFQAGKDVGLGAAIGDATSTLHAGIRIAQFRSRSAISINTEAPISRSSTMFNDASSRILRKFVGLGPSIAWDGSVPVAGEARDGELALDWTVAAALLFGRQTMHEKADATYQAKLVYSKNYERYTIGQRQQTEYTRFRRESVAVPNLGGQIGVSFRWSMARVSLGYRADFFFNAIDGGIATAKKEDRTFFGPYASIGIGIGGSDN